jgi:cytochrome c oxidase subunit II
MKFLQDVLHPAGPQAEHIAYLWWIMLAICALVFIAVLAFFLVGIARAPRATEATAPDLSPEKKAIQATVIGAAGLSIALLLFLIVASVATDRALARIGMGDPLTVEVTGHMWWWELRYKHGAEPSKNFTGANELHIPVGRTVLLELKAADVIHSFWVPNLSGKKDLIPGRDATLELRADKPGVYRGQCAEFCGYQHAKMAFLVIAEPPEAYEAWASTQRSAAPEPKTDAERHGRELFVQGTCAMCHAIQGTPASARHAPDLTHLASRQTIAAGTLPNSTGHLAGWILDPQRIKPGANMPANPLSPDDLNAMLAYLGTLK